MSRIFNFAVLLAVVAVTATLAQRGNNGQTTTRGGPRNQGGAGRSQATTQRGGNEAWGDWGDWGDWGNWEDWKDPEEEDETVPDASVCSKNVEIEDICVGQLNRTRYRFFYDSASSKCKMFFGCKPERVGNNFQKLEDCGEVCGADTEGFWDELADQFGGRAAWGLGGNRGGQGRQGQGSRGRGGNGNGWGNWGNWGWGK